MKELEEYIIDHPLNKENLSALISTFDRESFVPFVGAGLSVPLGASDWDKMLSSLSIVFNVKINKIKRPDGSHDYPRIFSNLHKKIEDKGDFFKKIFDTIEPTTTSMTGVHIKLVDLFNAYITTNFDSPIEKAYYNQHKERLKRYYFTSYGMGDLQNCIVYLHGHRNINFCIIKMEDYEYFYPTLSNKTGIPIVEEFLYNIFLNKRIIFIGFSFNDHYIRDYFELLSSAMTSKDKHYHYWLLSESSSKFAETLRRANDYKKAGDSDKANEEISSFFDGRMNIKPVVYKAGIDIFVERVFDKLMKSLPTKTISVEVSGIPLG